MNKKSLTQTRLTIISSLFDAAILVIGYIFLFQFQQLLVNIKNISLINITYIGLSIIYAIFRYRIIDAILPSYKKDIFKSLFLLILSSPTIIGLDFLLLHIENYNNLNLVFLILYTIFIVFFSRTLFHIFISSFFRMNGNTRLKVLLVGVNRSTSRIIDLINKPLSGMEVIGIMDNVVKKGEEINDVPLLGKINSIEEVLSKQSVDLIIQIAGSENTITLMTLAENLRIRFMILPDLLGIVSKSIGSVSIKNQLFLEPRSTVLSGWSQVFKRLIDLIISIVFLIVLSPIYLLIAIIVKLINPSASVFVSQKRVDGRNGREFKMWRFRTLPENIKELMPTKDNFKDLDKLSVSQKKILAKINPFSRFLRLSHLMDLPQFYNVLVGDMGIIGPRPPFLIEYENYDWFDRKRLLIKPGITGMWQIDKKEDTFEEMVRLDKWYVENWSFLLDLKIFLRTIIKLFSGRLSR
jgi:lipopolysaccharide/colanic/teichoic acid biosynthesis glycosyltransferase